MNGFFVNKLIEIKLLIFEFMNDYWVLIFNIVQVIFLVIIGLPTIYIFIFAFAGLFYKQKPYPVVKKMRKIAVLIPGYKEDDVILEVAKEAILQKYPVHLFDIIIIADAFQSKTIEKLKELPLILIEVHFDKSTKAKALNKAMEQLHNDYEIVIILDADNVMAKDFLIKINATFEGKYLAVQGHRTAKNMDTPLAILDAISEEINNHIFRKGHRVLGLSSALIGSGMAFKYDFFKLLMLNAKAIGGFDKEIELIMLKQNKKIEYLNDAIVYDEKVEKAEVFAQQRRRWLSAQFHYFFQDFLSSLKLLFLNRNFDYFDKAIQLILPPRILLLFQVFVFGIIFLAINLTINNHFSYSFLWLVIMMTCLLAFICSIPLRFYNLSTARALVCLPKGLILMLNSLLKLKGANKTFIHTKHSSKL